MSDQVIRPAVISEQKYRSCQEKALAIHEAILDVVTLEDVRCIYTKMMEKAKEGNLTAARMVLRLVLGLADLKERPRAIENSYVPASPAASSRAPAPSSSPSKPTSSSSSSSSASSGLTVDEVFSQPLTPQEMQAARAEANQRNTLNGGTRENLNRVNGGTPKMPPPKG